jgi:hypothetical protein
MTKALVNLQELRRRIYRKAKSEKEHRFWGIFVHVTRMEVLEEAYRQAKRNGGAPGIDGQTFEDVGTSGVTAFLQSIRDELMTGTYKPQANRFVEIPKGDGKTRTLQIPCIRDRVVQDWPMLPDGSVRAEQNLGKKTGKKTRRREFKKGFWEEDGAGKTTGSNRQD